MKNKSKKFSIKVIFYFLIIWLFTGFTLGTLTLMGPVRWAATFARNNDWAPSSEDWMVRIIILLFVIISFFVALWIYKSFNSTSNKLFKTIYFGIPIVTSALCLVLWMNPKMMQFSSTTSTDYYSGKQFDFGPFPDEAKLSELMQQNYTAVIALLHEAVVPFEPKLLAEEKETAQKIGIQFIHIPMLPWISENEESLTRLKEIADTGKGKYYVHCYLGKDRISVARRLIQKTLGRGIQVVNENARNIDTLKSFERGDIIKLDEGIYISPYPTDEEYFGFVLNGRIKKVVSLLSSNKESDISWIEKERGLLQQHMVDFELLAIDLFPYDPMEILNIVKKIKQMPRPLLVHAFLLPSPQTDIFIKVFNTDLPALHPYLFHDNMKNGKVEVLTQNIATGPQPEPNEFSDYLHYLGIRGVAFTGKRSQESESDKKLAEEAGLKWNYIDKNSIRELDENLTWFVYSK